MHLGGYSYFSGNLQIVLCVLCAMRPIHSKNIKETYICLYMSVYVCICLYTFVYVCQQARTKKKHVSGGILKSWLMFSVTWLFNNRRSCTVPYFIKEAALVRVAKSLLGKTINNAGQCRQGLGTNVHTRISYVSFLNLRMWMCAVYFFVCVPFFGLSTSWPRLSEGNTTARIPTAMNYKKGFFIVYKSLLGTSVQHGFWPVLDVVHGMIFGRSEDCLAPYGCFSRQGLKYWSFQANIIKFRWSLSLQRSVRKKVPRNIYCSSVTFQIPLKLCNPFSSLPECFKYYDIAILQYSDIYQYSNYLVESDTYIPRHIWLFFQP